MGLVKSKVIFDQLSHTYTLNGVQLQGITGMLGRQLFPDKYSDVPAHILQKSAERGAFIHEVCELIDELGISHDCEEAKSYMELKDLYGLKHEASEYLVSDNEHFASCIDKVYHEGGNDYSIGDVKTTSTLDKEYVRWQLSVYAYLFELQNPGCKIVRMFAIWLRGKNRELAEVDRIPDEIVKNLLLAEQKGTQFKIPYSLPAESSTLPDKYRKLEQSIMEISRQEKYWKEKKKQLMDGVMKEMVKAGAYLWKGEKISFTRKKDSIRKSFNKEIFDKDYPGVYDQYVIDTPVSGSITLKISE